MIDWRYPNHSLNGSFQDLGSFRERVQFEQRMIDSITADTLHVKLLYNRINYIDKVISKLQSTRMNGLSFSQHSSLPLFLTVSFMHLFRISNELKSVASKIRDKLNLHGIKYVALHIRTGQFDDDNLKEGNRSRFVH